jgi:hypothetical protein
MKRFVLCTVAVLLTSSALLSKPAAACPINPTCNLAQCNSSCIAKGAEGGACSGVCHTCVCLF